MTTSNMPPSPLSLRAFLTSAKKTLESGLSQKQNLHFVIGNESADLDSITSSLLYAYFRSHTPKPSSERLIHIPILNIPRKDIRIRRELLALLPHADVSPEQLLTLDDLASSSQPDGLKADLPPERTSWTLVDHNSLTGTLGELYSSRVTGCIDHHNDEDTVPRDSEPRIIEVAGSCTSLVANHFAEMWDLDDKSQVPGQADAGAGNDADNASSQRIINAQLAKLALASILVDTSSLNNPDKTTSHDKQAVSYLLSRITPADPDFDQAAFYKAIKDAKGDMDSLTAEEVLRKDYKEWTENGVKLGVSSVGKKVKWLRKKCKDEAGVKKDGAAQAFNELVEEFAEKRELGIYAIMTTSKSDEGEFQRELMLWSSDEKGRGMMKKFVEQAGRQLGLTRHEDGEVGVSSEGGKKLELWRQGKTENSRKQVAPLLRKAMSS